MSMRFLLSVPFWIISRISLFFRFLEEHAVGVLATLLVHLFVITLFLIAKINTTREHQGVQMLIEFEREQSAPKEREASQMSASDRATQAALIRSIPVNQAEAQAVQNIGNMVKDIKQELNVQDPPPSDATRDVPLPDARSATAANEAKVYDDKYPVNAQGERTVYRGSTTVSYRLDNRQHIYMPVPAYKCQGGGTVVVDIRVNRRGYVLQAEIKKELMAGLDPCFADAALRAAETTRFSSGPMAPEPQTGTITYVFIPQ